MNLARAYKRRRESYRDCDNTNDCRNNEYCDAGICINPNNTDGGRGGGVISGLIIGIVLLFSLALWIWAIVILVKYWKVLPQWAKVVGIIGLLPMVPLGPIVTIVVVYIGKESGHSRRR